MTERTDADGEVAGTPSRRRRRAVGPAGAVAAQPGAGSLAELAEQDLPEDDDERLLRDVPPHHGG